MVKWNAIGRAAGAAVLGGVLGVLPLATARAEVQGQVLSVSGQAQAAGPQGERGLACGENLREGEQVETSAGASVSFTAGDIYVQLGKGSTVRLAADGLVVEKGTARVIDTRVDPTSDAVVRTADGEIRGRGFDSEVSVGAAGTEVCERGAGVTAGGVAVPAGQCGTVSAGGVSMAPAGAARVAVAGAAGCVDVAVADQFSPTDVAAPPPRLELYPFDPDKRTLQPCDAPGSGCARTPAPPPEPAVVPPPPPAPPGFPPDQSNPAGGVTPDI